MDKWDVHINTCKFAYDCYDLLWVRWLYMRGNLCQCVFTYGENGMAYILNGALTKHYSVQVVVHSWHAMCDQLTNMCPHSNPVLH